MPSFRRELAIACSAACRAYDGSGGWHHLQCAKTIPQARRPAVNVWSAAAARWLHASTSAPMSCTARAATAVRLPSPGF